MPLELSAVIVGHTSRVTIEYHIKTMMESGLGYAQSQLIITLLQPEYRVTYAWSELLTQSLALFVIPDNIIASSSPLPSLGVPCLNLPLGTVGDEYVLDAEWCMSHVTCLSRKILMMPYKAFTAR